MSNLAQSLARMKERVASVQIHEQAVRAERFASFMNSPFYAEFKDSLHDKAMQLGLDAKTVHDVTEANGARKFVIELLEDLNRLERLAREIL